MKSKSTKFERSRSRNARRTIPVRIGGLRRPAADLPPNRYRQREIASLGQPRLESVRRRILRHEKSHSRYARHPRLRRAGPRAHGNASPCDALRPKRSASREGIAHQALRAHNVSEIQQSRRRPRLVRRWLSRRSLQTMAQRERQQSCRRPRRLCLGGKSPLDDRQ